MSVGAPDGGGERGRALVRELPAADVGKFAALVGGDGSSSAPR